MKQFFILLILFLSSISSASINPKGSALNNYLKENSSFIGGIAGIGFSITDIRRSWDQKTNVERLVIDIGDSLGSPHYGYPGFYQVQYSKKRLIINFSQMNASKIDNLKLSQLLSKSILVKTSKMTADPSDKSLNLIFDLNSKSQVRVFQVKGIKATSKLVLDFRLMK